MVEGHRSRFVAAGLILTAVVLSSLSCGDGSTEPAPVPPSPPVPPRPATVTVTPVTAELSALGATVAFAAEVRDQHGAVMPNASVSWSSSDARVAAVDGAGLATATDNGTATISATAGEASGSAALTVRQTVRTVTVTGPAAPIVEGDTVRLSAVAADANGHAVTDAEFAWASSDTTVAVIDDSGLLTGVAPGQATIAAMAGDIRGTAQVTVASDQAGDDRAALVALYEATDGPNWTNSKGWLTNAPLADWEGVWTRNERVVVLALPGNNLKGHIPPELGKLSGLIELWLYDNQLHGSIPPTLGDLSSLRDLSLGRNSLTGSIPQALGKLSSLVRLSLGSNRLSGSIPPELGDLSSLQDLRLGINELTGPIPPELGDLSSLQDLHLSRNRLTGSIPPELGKLASLRDLLLSGNELSGPIPSELGTLAALERLFLGYNLLGGH